LGKRADTQGGAGAERTEISGASSPRRRNVPELELVPSPKRQAILEGMLEAVGAEGYERTSVRTVLDRTGIYRQAFYDNFADKDDCYLQAYDEGVKRVEAMVLAAAAEHPDWTGQLRAGLTALLEFLDREPDVGRALLVEVHAAGAEALARRSAVMERINAFLDRAREQSAGAVEPPPIAGEGVVAGIHAIVHSRLATGGEDFRGLLPEFMYFAVLPYFGAEKARAEMQAARA
jgi:AcrR family transcriptional regulator